MRKAMAVALGLAVAVGVAPVGPVGPAAPARPAWWKLVACPAAAAAEPEEAVQTRRYLKVKNDTGEKLTVWLRYRTLTTDGEWRWYPGEWEKPLCYELDPGEETYLSHEGWKVNASRVRIWAETPSGEQLDQYQDEDLWLVPEEDGEGKHSYSAPQIEDFTFTFAATEQ
jgi:hypothetical protein